MSAQHNPTPARLVPEKVIRVALAAMIEGQTTAKALKVCARLTRAADMLEQEASQRASVYPITGGGALYGERPADLEKLEAARFLRLYTKRAREVLGGGQ